MSFDSLNHLDLQTPPTLQDYGFDYSDNEDANESGSVDVENMYYKAKCTSGLSIFERI
jgi:hypothetical protein